MRGPHEKNYYERASHWDAAQFDRGFESERLATTADLVPNAVRSVLDVGAGNGSFLKILEERRENLSVIGIERSVAAVQAASLRGPESCSTCRNHRSPSGRTSIVSTCSSPFLDQLSRAGPSNPAGKSTSIRPNSVSTRRILRSLDSGRHRTVHKQPDSVRAETTHCETSSVGVSTEVAETDAISPAMTRGQFQPS